jgi:phosphate transport system substrate-binding protein
MKAAFRILGLSAALAIAGVANAQVTGAGASFPAPVYSKWAADYANATKVQINYQSVGSGAGIKQINAKTVDFGASDKPLTDAQLKDAGLVEFPTVIGGVVPVVNIPGIKAGEIKLTGPVLADIYLGKIAKWNDKAIADLNPGVKLPDDLIGVVRRADGSGTSFIFTTYLSQVSPEWKEKVGANDSVNWPTGLGGKGNEGVAAFVGRLPNSIGYVEYAYAKQNKLAYVVLQNADGKYVEPTADAFAAAASGAKWNESFYQILTNQPGAKSWPITATTYILMHAKQDKPAQAAQVLKFFQWAYKNGDATAQGLDYVVLPAAVKAAVEKSWGDIKGADGKAISLK